MAWCHQATSHYLSQSRPSSLVPYGITTPQWVNPWNAWFILRKIYLHFILLLYIKKMHIDDILCHGIQGPIYPAYSIPLLVMLLWHSEPGHQHHSIDLVLLEYSGFSAQRVNSPRLEQNGHKPFHRQHFDMQLLERKILYFHWSLFLRVQSAKKKVIIGFALSCYQIWCHDTIWCHWVRVRVRVRLTITLTLNPNSIQGATGHNSANIISIITIWMKLNDFSLNQNVNEFVQAYVNM